MEELFNILSSSARLKKTKKKKEPDTKRSLIGAEQQQSAAAAAAYGGGDEEGSEDDGGPVAAAATVVRSRDRTGKRDTSDAKLRQVHLESIAAFRRSMNIRLHRANKHDPTLPDPVPSFDDLCAPKWWRNEQGSAADNDGDSNQPNSNTSSSSNAGSFLGLYRPILRNVEAGRWKEPTPIQMQAIPALVGKRDFIGGAPTGSGKSGAFIVPALLLSCAPYTVFYSGGSHDGDLDLGGDDKKKGSSGKKKKKKKKKTKSCDSTAVSGGNGQGEIRAVLLAPSLELANQLFREVQRLGADLPSGGGGGGRSSVLLSKANAPHVVAGTVGGRSGLDVLVSTPLRLVDCIEKGMRMDAVRVIVLDEADRLLDAADGKAKSNNNKKKQSRDSDSDDDDGNDEEEEEEEEMEAGHGGSGSAQSRTFLAQMDIILSEIPSTAVRALFSATVTPTVRSLAESILRNPIDVTIQASNVPGGANPDIDQELMFVGREEGKLLAMRQLVQRGQLRPPAIVFVQSQDRAQALFGELLYDGIRIDVIHAGRSKSARENAVAKFRRGDTWVLICTDLVSRGVDFRAVNTVINYDLPESGISYVHRIGRTGRAGRRGRAITLFTESDFENLRTIANIMKQSGCEVEEWMLNIPKNIKRQQQQQEQKQKHKTDYNNNRKRGREGIDTTPKYDKDKRRKKQQMIQQSKAKHNKSETGGGAKSEK